MKENPEKAKAVDKRSETQKESKIAENRRDERFQQQTSNPKLLNDPAEQGKTSGEQRKLPAEQFAKRKHRNYLDSFDDIFDR